jgi:hypothetical protein
MLTCNYVFRLGYMAVCPNDKCGNCIQNFRIKSRRLRVIYTVFVAHCGPTVSIVIRHTTGMTHVKTVVYIVILSDHRCICGPSLTETSLFTDFCGHGMCLM